MIWISLLDLQTVNGYDNSQPYQNIRNMFAMQVNHLEKINMQKTAKSTLSVSFIFKSHATITRRWNTSSSSILGAICLMFLTFIVGEVANGNQPHGN